MSIRKFMINLRKQLHQRYLSERQVLVKLMFRFLKVQRHLDKIHSMLMKLSRLMTKNILDLRTKTNTNQSLQFQKIRSQSKKFKHMSTLLNRKLHDLPCYRQQLKRSKMSNKSKQDLQLLLKLNNLQSHLFNRNLQAC